MRRCAGYRNPTGRVSSQTYNFSGGGGGGGGGGYGSET